MMTDLENTKVLITAGAILHNLAIKWKLRLEDEYEPENEDHDNNDLIPENNAGRFVGAPGNILRRHIIQDYFWRWNRLSTFHNQFIILVNGLLDE